MNRLKLLLLALPLLACATRNMPPPDSGSFAQPLPEADTAQLARDAAERIALACPPASTRLEFQSSTQDAFRIALASLLRTKGYAVLEPSIQGSQRDKLSAPTAPLETAQAAAPEALQLSYLIDSIGNTRLYRLKLVVGERSYSRAYLQENNLLRPAGAWVNQE